MPGGALARPASRLGLRTPARKANEFGFRTQTPGPEIQKVRPGGRPGFLTESIINKTNNQTQSK